MRYSFLDVPMGSTVTLPKINTEQDTNWYRCKLPLLVSMLDRYYKAVRAIQDSFNVRQLMVCNLPKPG